ncbi:MAG TPA: T9SS type A sorting domain-containing protein [Chitinophagaceae bacterium]|nr:T9SS type A sorting domain-containing protein [Chitinophagaceae bacterium]
MKTILLITALLLTMVGYAQSTRQEMMKLTPAIAKQASFESSINDEWLNSAEENIEEREYYFKMKGNSAAEGIFYAANRQHKLGFIIGPFGYTISPLQMADKVIQNWKEEISIKSAERGNDIIPVTSMPVIEANSTKMIYRYSCLSIEYTNDVHGLRQNFIIEHRPSGDGNLGVRLHMQGTLIPEIKNNQLQFNNNNGAPVLYYRDLHVWDANHKVLAANMSLSNEHDLLINVNDSNAVYPVTIDPVNQTPEWTGSAAGILPALTGQAAIDAAYGFSVAGVGDVNGDGYDDVAIGAPAMADVVSGTGTLASVGAVFIYYGSSNGLSSTPGVMLQPATAAAGALFGYSVAGGDINKDGKSDIIVGAPMDKVTISIGGGNTASGKIGKVYVFDGSTLSTNTNPLLTLQLNGSGILEQANISVNALFGFSVAVTEDLNGDGKKDIIVGAPAYAGVKSGLFGNTADVQSGGAFIFLSNAADNSRTMVSLTPPKSDILGIGLLSSNINGLLFGYSVDGLGDYNGDGKPDVVVSAPAGIDLSSINGLLNGKLLQGSAMVYYGTGSGINTTAGTTLTASSGSLLTNLTGTLANVANLFGTSVKGVRNAAGARNGNILVGAPLGGALVNISGLQLKTGTVSVFKKKSSSPVGYVSPDQVLSSPRNSSNILQLIQSNLLFGYSMDNTLDVNCDGIADIIVGEPASSGSQLINTNIAGGAAYVYLGNADGTYQAAPAWTLTANTDAFLGVNAASLTGYSVAGAGYTKGMGAGSRILAGCPAKTLDFGSGLLNLGNTYSTLFGLVAGDNGVGKACLFNAGLCTPHTLDITLAALAAQYINKEAQITWDTWQENNTASFEVERSTDGVSFSAIGNVKAAGNASTKKTYEFDDANVSTGNNYYRLKTTDVNGDYTYSNVVLLKVNISGTRINNVYPSPFTDKVNVSVSSATAGIINIRIVDLNGRSLFNKTYDIHTGSTILTVTGLGGLSKGMYMMQVHCGAETTTEKLLK